MQSMRAYQAFFLASFAGYLLLVLPFTNEMPMHEEVIHIRDTASWATALAYFCHPPLYALAARLARSVFGEGYRSMYLIGVFSALVNIYLVGGILAALSESLPERLRKITVLAGVWTVVLMPVFVHGSLLLEMEPTVLTPLCLLAIWYYVKSDGERNTFGFYVATGLLFGLSMWAKYFITPFLLIAALFLYEATSGRGFFISVRNSAVVLASALALFVPSYLLYSHFFIKGMNSFAFLIYNKPAEGVPILLSSRILFSAGTKLAAFTFWFSPFFIALSLYLVSGVLTKWKDAGKVRFFVLSIAAIFFFYLVMHPYPFGESKYFYPMFPLLAIVTVYLFIERGIKTPPFIYAALIPASAALMFFAVGDPLYQTLSIYRTGMSRDLAVYLGRYAAINGVIFISVFMLLRSRIRRLRDAACSSLAILAVSASISIFAHQSLGGYQTKIQYGETGAKETVSFVRSQIPRGAHVIVPGDIGFYSGVEFGAQGATMEEFGDGSGNWDWVVQRKVNIRRLAPHQIDALDARYDLVEEIGSYGIYRKKGEPQYDIQTP